VSLRAQLSWFLPDAWRNAAGTGWLLRPSDDGVKLMTAHHRSDSEPARGTAAAHSDRPKQSFPQCLSAKPNTVCETWKVQAHVLEVSTVLSPSCEGRLTPECAQEGRGTPAPRSQIRLDSPLLCK